MGFIIKHPKIFEISETDCKFLASVSSVISDKFEYDHDLLTLNQIKPLTSEDLNKLEEIAKKNTNEEISPTTRKQLLRIKSTGATVLVEEETKCPFRVVTDNPKLTNSFWNLFY